MNKTFLRDNLKRILLVLLGSFLAALGVQLSWFRYYLLTAGIAGFAASFLRNSDSGRPWTVHP